MRNSGKSSRPKRVLLVRLASCSILIAGSVVPAAGTIAEGGGSGLLTTDYAWSMPFRGFVVSTHVGYFSNDISPGGARFMSFTPSVTKGLSNGFEAAAALPFEVLSGEADATTAFDHRFDVRQRDLLAKLRWSGPLGGPRLRWGLEGILGAPLFGEKTRDGGDRTPSSSIDAGLVGLLSANVGGPNFPLRLHLNGGYWWSRDDGAVYLRQLPSALPLAGSAIVHNDLLLANLAVEAGFSRFIGFVEVTTEQLVGARAQVRGRENLWRVTPGVRAYIGQNIGLTAGLSLDFSQDDGQTAFNPTEAFPDYELRVGLMLGSVLTRQRYEARTFRRSTSWEMAGVDGAGDDAEASEPTGLAEAGSQRAPEALAPATLTTLKEPRSGVGTPARDEAGPHSGEAAWEVVRLEERLARVELGLRMAQLEARLHDVERRIGLPAPPGPAWSVPEGEAQEVLAPHSAAAEAASGTTAEPGASGPTSAVSLSRTRGADAAALDSRLVAMQRQLDTLARHVSRGGLPAPAAGPGAVSTETAEVSSLGPVQRSDVPAGARAQTLPPIVVQPPASRAEPAPALVPQVVTPPPAPALRPQLAPSRDPETAALWAEIDRLADELLVDVAGSPPREVEPTRFEAAVEAEVAPSPPVSTVAELPLAPGERTVISEIDVTADNPLADASARAALDSWAALLTAHPEARVALLVHAGDADREAGLARSTAQAAQLREYLVIAGAAESHVVAIGMGAAEPLVSPDAPDASRINARLEIERLR